MGGFLCKKSTKFNPAEHGGDLPMPDISKITDPIVKFEMSFPFCRMHITRFSQLINSLGKDDVEMSTLDQVFETPAW